ncbi:hypothetical protein B0T18DRAFT_57859 [Schizothecium vesticola]|uniref:Uncharacterized protein n=1 Tax=Schizothecium vesticola TaxID=314040 RepID=A0AA40KA00_9PEZI|nr:hypothetical protein B0T18DRAFT_57859 [Schizothecium vesticola]
MDSLKRSITSARRPREVIPMDAPVDEMGVYIPQYQLNRRESVLVDPSDPSAALVRRAKSTREGPKRSISTSVKRLDSTAEDGADGDGVRSPRQNSWKGHQKAQSHSQVLDLSSTAESSLLKKRPSLRDRFKSLRLKQSTIPDSVEEEEAKTPTDARFVYRPKHQALDWTDLAAQLQVPRGPSFDASGPSSAPLPRASIEKNPFQDTLAVPSANLSKSKSTRDPSRNNDHAHSHAPTPAATAEAIQKNPRQQGECRRCHSKRVQRSMSARKSTAADPRIQFDWAAYRNAKETGLPSPAYKERETTVTLSPRLSVNAPQINTPVITTTDSNGTLSKEWDPFNDYERLVREAEAAEAVERRTGRASRTATATSRRWPSTASRSCRRARRRCRSVAAVLPGGGMANRRSVTMEMERKSVAATQEEKHPLPPRPLPLRRQRSVAQRMMDTFVRPLAGKRSQSVKPGNRTPLN